MTEIARVYGGSLYELAGEENLTDEILEELDRAVELFRENPEYTRLMMLPSVPKNERCAALDESFGGRVHQYLLNFMKILVEKGAIGELGGCAEAFRLRYNEDNGIMPVTAVTAVKMEEGERTRLVEKLSEIYGKKIVLSERVEPGILGGVRLEMDGKRFDGTVSGRLEEIQKALFGTVL